MQATTGISSLQMVMGENTTALSNEKLCNRMMHMMKKTNWDSVISKIDKQISRGGAFTLFLSVLYFAPILVSILLR